MEIIEIVGLESFYDKKFNNPSWIKLHKSTLESIQFSKLKPRQILLYYSLVFLAIEYKNEVPIDLIWIKSKTNRKILFSDLDIFQALGLLKRPDSGLQNRREEKRIEKNRREENGREEKRIEKNPTSFSPKSKNQNENGQEKLREKTDEILTQEEIERFKKNFGSNPEKYLGGLIKTI